VLSPIAVFSKSDRGEYNSKRWAGYKQVIFKASTKKAGRCFGHHAGQEGFLLNHNLPKEVEVIRVWLMKSASMPRSLDRPEA
jgi:hypothetical protein